jgi:transposase
MDEKKEFIFRCWNREEPFTEICRKFGISTKTGYKWLARFKEQGAAGLAELSRAPKHPTNKVTEAVKKRLLKLKEKYKYWGAYKILMLYATKYPANTYRQEAPLKNYSKKRATPGGKRG